MTPAWNRAPLQQLTDEGSPITYGVVKPGAEGDVRFIRGGDIAEGVILEGQLRTISWTISQQYRRTLLRGGELLICLVGTPGEVGVVPRDLAGANIARQVGLIRLREGICVDFVSYFFRSPEGRAALGLQTGGSVQQVINLSDLRLIEVPVPPLPEQRRIVAILNEALDGIAAAKANTEKNLRNARAVFESHLNAVFSRSSDRWFTKPLGSVCDIKHGFAFDGADFSRDIPEGNPIIVTPGNFTEDGTLAFSERNTKRFDGEVPTGFRFEVGDLVVVMTDLSSKMKILGKPAFVESEGLLHNQRIGKLIFINGHVQPRYVYYFMMSDGFLNNIKQSATGTMVKHTAPKRILSNLVPFPPDKGEQLSIVASLDTLRAESQRLQSIYRQKLAALEALKKSLLHQAFSGEL